MSFRTAVDLVEVGGVEEEIVTVFSKSITLQ